MNFQNLARQDVLESAVILVKKALDGEYQNSSIDNCIGYNISGVKFNSSGDPIIASDILFRYPEGIVLKKLSYTVINDSIYPVLPLKPLCDH